MTKQVITVLVNGVPAEPDDYLVIDLNNPNSKELAAILNYSTVAFWLGDDTYQMLGDRVSIDDSPLDWYVNVHDGVEDTYEFGPLTHDYAIAMATELRMFLHNKVTVEGR